MTTLDAYARFLTARWDEAERHVEFVRDFIPDEGNQGEYIDPRDALADLAAKRAILQEVIASEDPATWVLMCLAEPFRDHPNHPANQET